jgi:hypothetical protein
MERRPGTKVIMLNEENWRLVRQQLKRGTELHSYIGELVEDAMTFGESEGEFYPDDFNTIMGTALECLEKAARR